MRLPADGSRISAAVIGVRDHAYGLATATSLKCCHNAATRSRCASTLSPRRALIAVSNNG